MIHWLEIVYALASRRSVIVSTYYYAIILCAKALWMVAWEYLCLRDIYAELSCANANAN